MGVMMMPRSRILASAVAVSIAAGSAFATETNPATRILTQDSRKLAASAPSPSPSLPRPAASQPQTQAPTPLQFAPQSTFPSAESALPHRPLNPAPSPALPTVDVPPFGANLFARPFQAERPDALNPDYVIVPGDQIAVRVWGAAQTEEVSAVDTQGNIFISNIGPVKVAGTRAGDLQRRVRQAVASVYTNNVEVYVTLLTTTPIEVFVTGAVKFPGQYSGTPSDSTLTFLHRAGGIDPDRGSFRKVRLKRHGREVMQADLYRFLREGQVPLFQFRDGDVIMVEERGPSVTVQGPTLNPFRFELSSADAPGEEIAFLARPLPRASHVAVAGNRAGGPFNVYVTYEAFRQVSLQDGDIVRFEADEQTPMMTVSVEGSHLSPSTYSVSREATLAEFLDHVPVNPQLAATESIYVRRQSVARQQQELLDRSLRQLEQSVLTAPTRSDGEAEIRVREADLIRQFVERAREVRPEGRIVVTSDQGRAASLRLEPGDVVVVPGKTDVVLVGGEVLMPQAILYRAGARIDDYVKFCGGYSARADEDRVLVIRQNGAIETGRDIPVRPGDQVVVMPEIEFKSLQVAKDIVQIMYQIAIASAVLLLL
jgi:protein involved in polysaccharide export with SLBB domain